MTLNEKLIMIRNCFAELGLPLSHYWHPVKNAPLLMWSETGEEVFHADNRHGEMVINGVMDYYTLLEFDPAIDAIQAKLDDTMKTWSLDSVQYEDAMNLIHYSWSWVA